jgi:glutamate decarboxylase
MALAQAPRGGEAGHRPAEPGLRRRRPRRLGQALPLLRHRAAHDIPGIDALLGRVNGERYLDVALHVDGASGGFVWPFLYPDDKWDFQHETVRSINVSGHKFGMVYPGIGWLVFRSRDELPEDLVFYENYLGERDATYTLNISTGASMVLAQYYNFCRLGQDGYRRIIEAMDRNPTYLEHQLEATGRFELIRPDDPQLPLACWKLASDPGYDEFDVSGQLAAERGWMVPAYSLPPNADKVNVMRALVKENVSHAAARTLADDISKACETLDQKGGLHESERARVKRSPGY